MPRLPSRHPATAVLIMLSLALALPASAAAPVRAVTPPPTLVTLELIDRASDVALPAYLRRGTVWVAGPPGAPYAVRLTNTTRERVLVVLSVDGVNTVTGDTAHPAQAGYVLAPGETSDVTGWRKSYDDIARFLFTDLPESYAARTGRPDDVGAIGIAVFKERRMGSSRPIPRITASHPEVRPAASATTASAATAKTPPAAGARRSDDAGRAQRIGTGHGERERAPVVQTTFVRATSAPAQLTTLRYDTPAALARMGMHPAGAVRQPAGPQAFPGRFVADPPVR